MARCRGYAEYPEPCPRVAKWQVDYGDPVTCTRFFCDHHAEAARGSKSIPIQINQRGTCPVARPGT